MPGCACSGADRLLHCTVPHPELCAQPQACWAPVVRQCGQQHLVVDFRQGLLACILWNQAGQLSDFQDHAEGFFKVHERVHW